MAKLNKAKFNARDQRGVASLLELMVALSIFTVIILSTMSIFQWVIEGQRNSIAAQNIQESMRYSLEMIGKEIRNAKVAAGFECNVSASKTYETGSGGTILYLNNKDGDCVIYSLQNDANGVSRIRVDRGADFGFLTPGKVKITNLKFIVIDDGSSEPKLTLAMNAEAIGKALHRQITKIQTTISSRNYKP